jgi:hypothetical protein
MNKLVKWFWEFGEYAFTIEKRNLAENEGVIAYKEKNLTQTNFTPRKKLLF